MTKQNALYCLFGGIFLSSVFISTTAGFTVETTTMLEDYDLPALQHNVINSKCSFTQSTNGRTSNLSPQTCKRSRPYYRLATNTDSQISELMYGQNNRSVDAQEDYIIETMTKLASLHPNATSTRKKFVIEYMYVRFSDYLRKIYNEDVVIDESGSYAFPIPELGITLKLPSALQPYLQYKKTDYGAIELFLTNYRDMIPSSEIPSYEDVKEHLKTNGYSYAQTYSVAEYEQLKNSSKKCHIMSISTQQPKKEIYFGSVVLAENDQKQVIVTYPHEPCDPFHFFSLGKASPDSTEITAYDKYIAPLVLQFKVHSLQI